MNATLYALAAAFNAAAERTDPMPLKPRVKVKAKGIPIGSYEEIRDAAGKQLIKPKRKPAPPHAQYAAKSRKKWKAAK